MDSHSARLELVASWCLDVGYGSVHLPSGGNCYVPLSLLLTSEGFCLYMFVCLFVIVCMRIFIFSLCLFVCVCVSLLFVSLKREKEKH